MPLPVAHAIVGASIVAAARDNFSLSRDWKILLLGATIAVVPDFDLILSWVLGYGLKAHGGFTHSIVFSVALGSAVSLLAREKSVKGFLAYIAASISHGLLDVVTKKEFGGAQLLWPISDQRYRLGLLSNYEFYPDPDSQQISDILKQMITISINELIIFLPLLLVVVYLKNRRSIKWKSF